MSEGAELFPASADAPGAAPRSRSAAYQVLARRVRPQAFADVVGQEHVTQTLVNAIRAGRVAHAFVFAGMRGVGKTTTARILAKALNCEQGPTAEPCNRCRNCVEITESRALDVFEVDAASQTGIDAARELLETVKYRPASGRYRIYIIDEAHGLSKQAVDAFLKTLEEPPPHVKFILATTAAHKLPATILSRCQRFDFRAVPVETIARVLGEIARREGVEADEEALAALARESGGSMRDAASLLDQVMAFTGGQLALSTVVEALGLPDRRAVRELLTAVAERSPGVALEVLGRVCAQGTDLARFCADLLERLRHLTVLAVAGRAALADLAAEEVEELGRAARGLATEDLQRWFRLLLAAHGDLTRAPDPRLVLEMAVVRMATLVPVVPVEALLARLEVLETERNAPHAAGGRSGVQEGGGAGGVRGAGSGDVIRAGSTRPRSDGAEIGGSKEEAVSGVGTAERRPALERPTTSSAKPAGEACGPDQERWRRLVDALQRESASRYFRLSYSRVLEVGEGRIRVAVIGREAVGALLEPVARSAIERAIEREFGRSLAFDPVAPAEGAAATTRVDEVAPERQAREDPVVQLSVELLEGRVEAVMPRTRR